MSSTQSALRAILAASTLADARGIAAAALRPAATKRGPRRQACESALRCYGRRWSIDPATSIGATIPAAWANCKIFGGTKHGPRDMRVPLAVHWPDGEYPAGMILAAPVRYETAPIAAPIAAELVGA